MCCGCYNARQFLKLNVDGDTLHILILRRSRGAGFGAYERRWRSLSRSSSDVFFNMPDLFRPFVRYATGVEYVCRIRERFCTDISL